MASVSETALGEFRLDAEGLESKHFGEVSCREYRESILHNLPHQWSSRGDTKLVLSHFVKHKPGKGSEKKSLGDKGGKSSGMINVTLAEFMHLPASAKVFTQYFIINPVA